MRINYLTSVHLDVPSAPAHHVIGTCTGLASLGHHVSLVYPRREILDSPYRRKIDSISNEQTYWYPAWRGGWRFFEWCVARHLQSSLGQSTPDVLYFRCSPSHRINAALAQIKQLKVMELNGLEIVGSRSFKESLKCFDLVMLENERTRHILAELFPNSSEKMRVHKTPGTDTKLFRPLDKHACRTELGLPEDRRIILHVSGFQAHHDFETLSEAVRLLDDDWHPYLVLLVGNGPRWGIVRDMFSDLISADRVRMPGSVPLHMLPHYIGSADVCVSLPTSDTLSEGNLRAFKVYEYAACERPIVEAVNFDLPIEDWAQKSMILVPPASPKDVAKAIERALSRPNHDLALGREHVKRHRSWEAVTASTLTLIEEEVDRRVSTSCV